MENKAQSKNLTLGISILVGLTLLGYFVFKGLKTFSDKDRVVTVKGLAEMNMTATSSSTYLSFSFSGDNLQEILKKGEDKKTAILEYLKSIGIAQEAIKVHNLDINDQQKYYETQWKNDQEIQVKIDRYSIIQGISIQSKDVKATEDKSAKIEMDLVSKDLTCTLATNYTFPELNSIKPQLIAESTKNARIAGEQFANDSQASLGKIKTASQGQITVAGKYYYNEDGGEASEIPSDPYIQKARVVSTIVFFLE